MKFVRLLFICVLSLIQATGALAAGKTAVVNIRYVAKNSDAGRGIDDQLAEINDKSKKDLLDLESSIKKMDSDAKTSSDERKVEDLQVILYDMTKEKRYQIQTAYHNALEQLEQEIHKVVEEISNEKGYSLVVISDVIVFNSSECPDITQETIERLNKRVPKIKVDMKKSKEVEDD